MPFSLVLKQPHPLLCGPNACPFLQRTISQILASTEAFSRFETILEVSWGKGPVPSDLLGQDPSLPRICSTVIWGPGVAPHLKLAITILSFCSSMDPLPMSPTHSWWGFPVG